MENYIIGIDSGTTGIKAVAFDLQGKEVCKQGYPLNGIFPEENWYEEDMFEIWDKAKLCIQAITAKLPKESIIGIGITAQGDGLWMIDENGEPVRNGCCFCDGRSAEFVDQWSKDGTIEKVFEIAGTRMFTGNQNGIVLWMEKYEPENLKKAKYLLHLKDYLFYKLTGEITTDATDQSLVFLNMKTRDYDDRLFEIFGLQKYRDKYPPVKSSKENAAQISAKTAEEMGLSSKVLVTSGPMDVSACALGSGVVEKAHCCSILGTAALHEMVIDEPCADNIMTGMTVAHVMENRWLRLMASLAGTPNLEWLLQTFGKSVYDQAAQKGMNVYAHMEALIKNVPIGSNGILYHPYLLAGGERAPFTDPRARASFTGISVRHKLEDIIRACYEGVAFAMLDCYNHMPIEPQKITVCGGGANSAVWCQMFSDALGKPLVTVDGQELGAKGVILNNAVIQGLYADYSEAVNATVKTVKGYEPDMHANEQYKQYYVLYKRTYELLSETWKLRNTVMSGKTIQ